MGVWFVREEGWGEGEAEGSRDRWLKNRSLNFTAATWLADLSGHRKSPKCPFLHPARDGTTEVRDVSSEETSEWFAPGLPFEEAERRGNKFH